MAVTSTRYEHVVLGDGGVAVIAGTTVKVVELVADRLAYGWSPEEMQYQHPHLTLGQIHSALAYYWDHAAELDQDVERRVKQVDEHRRAAGPSSLAARLRSAKEIETYGHDASSKGAPKPDGR